MLWGGVGGGGGESGVGGEGGGPLRATAETRAVPAKDCLTAATDIFRSQFSAGRPLGPAQTAPGPWILPKPP